jgi:hypothetical protein
VPERPIFIVGAMGSGTTLLRLMLDSHPAIAVPPETGFMRSYNAQRFAPFKHSGRHWAGRLGWSEEELDAELRAFYDRLFTRYAEQHGKRRWGEKTPLHTWHVENIARLFPDAVFVGMVRHPLGSVGSNLSRFTAGMRQHARHWERYSHEVVAQALRHPERFVLLRYEDLVLRPREAMGELLDWLGEPWSDAVLSHHEVQAGRGGVLTVEGRSRADDPIDVSRIHKWQGTLGDEEKQWLAGRLKRRAEFFGYALDGAALEPLGASLLIRAAELAARAERYPDLGLEKAGKRSPFEDVYDPRKVTLVAHKWKRKNKPPLELRVKQAGFAVRERIAPLARRVRHWARRYGPG